MGLFYFMAKIKFICEEESCDYLEVIKGDNLIDIFITTKLLQEDCNIEESLSVSLNIDDVKLLIYILNNLVNKIEKDCK